MRKFILAGLPVALISITAAAASTYGVVPGNVGDTARYHFSFNGHFWNGVEQKRESDMVLSRKSATDIAATSTSKIDGKVTQQAGTLRDDGTIAAKDSKQSFLSLNTAALMQQGAPSTTPGAGQSWNTKLPVPISQNPQDDLAQIPVKVTVAQANGDALGLQATGTESTTISASGYTVPVDVTVRAAGVFAGGKLQSVKEAVSEVVHAGPQTQTITWEWTLSAQ